MAMLHGWWVPANASVNLRSRGVGALAGADATSGFVRFNDSLDRTRAERRLVSVYAAA
jgi:hypothetical protein